MKLSFKHLLFICISFFFYSVSFAQLSDTSKVISLSAHELYFNRSDNEEKMSSDLFYKVVHFLKETYKGQSVQKVITELKKDEFSTFDDQNRLLVFIRLKSNSKSDETQLVNLINNSGGEVYHQEVGHNNLSEITAYLPIQAIIKIADNEKTALIKKPIPILFHIYKSLGDEQLKAQQVRQLFNVDGSNIKIGVISDGADKWSQAYVANELPMISIIRNGSGDEGTAMMEIIHDLAPSSELIFAGVKGLLYPVNWAFIAGLVNELHYTRGCKIIVDDFYTPEAPFYSDEGLFGEAIRNFTNDGGVYITAAGNSRKSLYSGITSLGSGYHIFPDGKDYLEFVLEGSDYLYLQWSTRWTNPSIDLDFEALNTTTNTTYYSSSNQSYTTPPIENLDLTEPGVYRLKIKKRTGLESVEFKILSVRNNNITNNNTRQIFGHSAYPNVISVAAYQANNQNTTSDNSSIGPALMYSTAIQDWTVQEVPTITATSGVETWVGSTGLWSGGYPVFDGTSASAPHIAGLAALYFHKLNGIENLNKSNMDFRNDLTLSATTLEIGTGGIWNNRSGFGKANILEAIIRNLTSVERVATPVFNPPGGGFNSAQNIEITCSTPGPDVFIYYTNDGSEPNQNSTLYTGQFEISNNVVLKAKAFKEGLIESFTATEAYQIYQDIYPLTINQLDYSNSPFGEFDYWFQNQWVNKPTGTTLHFSFQQTMYVRLKFLQDFKEGTTQKFHYSKDANHIYFRNNDNVYFPADGNYVNGHFRPSNTATIVNALEGFETVCGGTLEFKDPWLVDVNDPQNRFYFHPFGYGNLGNLVPWIEENGIINAVPNEQSKYKGVFLGLTPSLNRGIYNLRVPKNFTVTVHGKSRQFNFQNWSTENATVLDPNNIINDKYETRLVFNSDNAKVKAVYKGAGLSNQQNAYSNNSQRKFLYTNYGTIGQLHSVYESMGQVYYEMSTDRGVTWQLMNQGLPFGNQYFQTTSPSLTLNGPETVFDEEDILIAYQTCWNNCTETAISVAGFHTPTDN